MQDPVQVVQVVQHQEPGLAQVVVQLVGYVEQGPEGLHILGRQDEVLLHGAGVAGGSPPV